MYTIMCIIIYLKNERNTETEGTEETMSSLSNTVYVIFRTFQEKLLKEGGQTTIPLRLQGSYQRR